VKYLKKKTEVVVSLAEMHRYDCSFCRTNKIVISSWSECKRQKDGMRFLLSLFSFFSLEFSQLYSLRPLI